MTILICTAFSIVEHSAGRNRIFRLIRSLRPHGIEAILVGFDSIVDQAWRECNVSGIRSVGYSSHMFRVWRHCRAMRIGAQSARFYSNHLDELIKTFKCDGIIDYSSQAQISTAVVRAARAAGVFVVGDLVERHIWNLYDIFNGMNWQQSRLYRSVVPQLDGVIGISRRWCAWAEARGIRNVWIPSFAEDRGQVRSMARPENRPFTMAFIGHWVAREVPHVFLRAIRICLDSGFNVQLNVLGTIGTSPRERSAMQVLRSDPVLFQHVHFLGFLSDGERDRQLADADAFLLLRPDNRETDMLFPTRLPEYMLSGNPVILSQVGSFRDVFTHRRDVWFIPARNSPDEVADAIKYLILHPDERAAIGMNGRETMLKHFSLEVLGRRLAKFLGKCQSPPLAAQVLTPL